MTQVSRLENETSLQLQASERFRTDDLRQFAFSFHGLDWACAVRVWEAFRLLFPDDPDGFAFGTLALREAGRLAEAQALSDSVLATFAHHVRLFVERALICFITRDWPEAKRRLAHIRKVFPGDLDGYVRGAEVAQIMGQHNEALRLMEAATRRFADNRSVLEDYARLADRLSDCKRSAAAWGEHRERYGEAYAFIGQARGLADSGDLAAAEIVLAEGRVQHPDAVEIRLEAARMAVRRADWSEVVRRWTSLADDPAYAEEARSRLKDAAHFTSVLPGGVAASGSLGGIPLDVLLSKTWIFRFKTGQVLGRNLRLGPHGELLNNCGSERRWTIRGGCLCLINAHEFVTTTFTGIEHGIDGRLRLIGRDWLHYALESHYVLEEQRPTIATVMTAFESIGDNCEFGLVQRFHRTESIGFLRFSSSGYDHLMAGLTSKFAGLDDPDCVSMRRDQMGELIGCVKPYDFFYHTHRYNTDIDIAVFAKREAGRLRHLADLLIENIQDGSKIFVRRGEKASELGKILSLHDAMKRHGNCKLLWVTDADETHPAGTMEMIGDGLIHGYLGRLAPSDAAAMAPFDEWTDLCDRVHRLVHPEAWDDLRLPS